MRPHNFRKLLSAAARIHTTKCSSCSSTFHTTDVKPAGTAQQPIVVQIAHVMPGTCGAFGWLICFRTRQQEKAFSCAPLAQEMLGAHLEGTIEGAASSERGICVEVGGRSAGKLVVDVRWPGNV